MSKIDRAMLARTAQSGVRLDEERLTRGARRAGVTPEELASLDLNEDGVLRDEEVEGLFEVLAAADREDDSVEIASFDEPEMVRLRGEVDLGFNRGGEVGADTELYHGIVEAIEDPGERRVAVAQSMSLDPRLAQGFRGRREDGPDNRMLSHNPMHRGRTREDGLIRTNYADAYRCNLFVGDALWRSGGRPPTIKGPGWVHYALAEQWPSSSRFESIGDLSLARPGDILVIDSPVRGSGGGHLEIITSIERARDGEVLDMISIGARWAENAIVEDNARAVGIFNAVAAEDERGAHFLDEEDGTRYFILRPRGERVMDHQQEVLVRL